MLLRGILMKNVNKKYKKYLRQKLFYFLDVVGLDNLNSLQKKEFEKITSELGIRKTIKGVTNFKKKQETTLPFSFNFEKFTSDDYYRLLRQGYKINEIEQMCGVSNATFYYWRKKRGLMMYDKNCQEKVDDYWINRK